MLDSCIEEDDDYHKPFDCDHCGAECSEDVDWFKMEYVCAECGHDGCVPEPDYSDYYDDQCAGGY